MSDKLKGFTVSDVMALHEEIMHQLRIIAESQVSMVADIERIKIQLVPR